MVQADKQAALIHYHWSVIIVTYQSADVIGPCLSSVLEAIAYYEKQLHITNQCQVIVVDSASTDGTPAKVRSFPSVALLVSSVNLGYSGAVNWGFRKALGRWVLILNPDCVIDRRSLFVLAKVFQCYPDAGVLGLHLRNADSSFQPSGRLFPTFFNFIASLFLPKKMMVVKSFRGRSFAEVEEVDEVSGAAFAVVRDLFNKGRLMDESFFLYFEDIDLCRRARNRGFRVFWVRDAVAVHRWGASTEKASGIAQAAFLDSAIKYSERYHGKMSAFLVRGALIVRYLLRVYRRRPSPQETWLCWQVLLRRGIPFRSLVTKLTGFGADSIS
ncbi:MAG: glycosyltransferase family 2 protein [Armatimonadetes bacterium]|nr:glycosyltransferase family 2 protein [Armatimonadota bacterium]MDW8121077.1 glycosyltransferase family 2 protein [Armatimonadota bacterium]